MEKFTLLESPLVVLPVANIDTDQIIPARFLKVTDKKGLGDNLFYDWRYDDQGQVRPDFILNRPLGRRAQILVAGDNFGCGSSREHAPWALRGYGFRAVVSSSFADIFSNNALKNGILPVIIPAADLARLLQRWQSDQDLHMRIDLASQQVTLPCGREIEFPIDAFNKTCLLEGIDTLGYLLQRGESIDAYEASHSPRVQTQ